MNPFNPNNPNLNQPNVFTTPGYTPTIDPSWASPQFTFSGFLQSPNAFQQMSNVQQMQQWQALQQMMLRNTFESQPQIESQPPTSPVGLDDDEEEIVPESPPQRRKNNKGKNKKGKALQGDTSTKDKSMPWSKIEKEALAMAWVKSSTNPIIGNNQTGDGFWKQITARYNEIMKDAPYRNLDSISSKWRKMVVAINNFSGIYNRYYSHPPSGSSEDDILKLALDKWDDTNKRSFQHLQAWKVLKKENKWRVVPNEVESAKQSKTSESGSYSVGGGSTARCHIDINDEPESDEAPLEFAVHESERPPGRDKAKKAVAAKKKLRWRAARTKRLRVADRKWTS